MSPADIPIKTPDQRLRVFISSTIHELAEERKAVRAAVESLRLTPILFELGARPHPPRDLYRAYLAQSHIFVGIYHEQYGWIAPDSEISGIEDEFRLAGDMPMLLYIKEPGEMDERLKQMLEDGRRALTSRTFATPEELAHLVAEDLAVVLTQRFESGGRGDNVSRAIERRPPALPVQPTPFIGRDREIAELVALLERDGVRLVTLTGPGGIGKSRLAFEVAERLLPRMPDGVHHALLASVTDAQLAVNAIAQALGVGESAERTVLDNIKEYLRDAQMLLVLDNFEHVIGAAPAVSSLLAGCPGLKILVTSRAALRLRDEHEYDVPPLAVPLLPARVTLQEALKHDAVRLFVDRAASANPRFGLTEENVQVVAEICMSLDGLPLAVELAAARTRLLPPEAMLPRLQNRLKLLTGGPRDLPARQRTLRAALDWDYDLLTEQEKGAFRRLSVFSGGFHLAAGAEAIDLDRNGSIDPLEMVDSLLSKSLLRQDPRFPDEPRFTMLRTLREYGLEKLAESDEESAVKQIHIDGFLSLAENAAPRLREADQVEWMDVLEREHDNLRAALRWLVDAKDGVKLLRLAGALAHFWEYRGYLSEGQRWLEDALSVATDAPPGLRAAALEGAGILARGQGEFKRAASLIEECAEIRRELGDKAGLASAVKNLGIIRAERGDQAGAADHYMESLELREEIGDRRGVAEIQNNLGVLARAEEDWEEAADLYEAALRYFRERDDKHGLARVLMNLSEAMLELNRFEEAEKIGRESIELFDGLGSRWDLCDLFEGMGAISNGLGRPEEGATLFGAAAALRDLIGAPLPPSELGLYDRRLAAIKKCLDAQVFDHAWNEGRGLTVEQAVSLALGASLDDA